MRLLSFLCYTYFRKILCQSLMFHFFCLRLSSEAIPKMRNGSRTKFCENEQTKILVSTLLPFTKSFRIPVSFAWLTRRQKSGVVWGEGNYMKNVGHMCDVWKFPTILIIKNCNIIPLYLDIQMYFLDINPLRGIILLVARKTERILEEKF